MSTPSGMREVGAEPVEVRTPGPACEVLDGLILPGGESTTMLKFLERGGFFELLQDFVRRTPTFGTCAGAILLATHVESPAQRSLGALDITVERNAYGRQIDSAILAAPTSLPGGPLEMVFIRAPRIRSTGPGVETLATRDGFPTLVRSNHILAATFHPELSADPRVHQLFLNDRLANTNTEPTAPSVPARTRVPEARDATCIVEVPAALHWSREEVRPWKTTAVRTQRSHPAHATSSIAPRSRTTPCPTRCAAAPTIHAHSGQLSATSAQAPRCSGSASASRNACTVGAGEQPTLSRPASARVVYFAMLRTNEIEL